MLEINKDLKFLRKKSKKVENINDEIRELVLEMVKAMKANDGAGLAACQVGYLKRIIVIKDSDDFISLINPIIFKKSKEKSVMSEGCLSLPNCFVNVKRPKKVKVKALDLTGKEIIFELESLRACIFQHEMDHLNGILITDKVSFFQRIKNRFLK